MLQQQQLVPQRLKTWQQRKPLPWQGRLLQPHEQYQKQLLPEAAVILPLLLPLLHSKARLGMLHSGSSSSRPCWWPDLASQ